MNKDAILHTANTQWSDEDECFVTRSPLSDVICGAGETETEAWASFQESVTVHWEEYRAGRHGTYRKAGRPRKHKIKFAVEIDPDIKAGIAAYAEALGMSQGEVVEYLCRFYDKAPAHFKSASGQ